MPIYTCMAVANDPRGLGSLPTTIPSPDLVALIREVPRTRLYYCRYTGSITVLWLYDRTLIIILECTRIYTVIPRKGTIMNNS